MDASSEERQAISSFLDTAQKIVPALKVRFIERLPDEGRPFLRIGVALPDGVKATSDEAYELHQLAADMSDSLCDLSVWTSPIAGGYELISMEGIVEAERRSADLVYVMPKLPAAKPMRRIPTLPGQIAWICLVAFSLLLAGGVIGQAITGMTRMMKSTVGTSSVEVQGLMSQVKLRRTEFLKALDAYIQSQNKHGKADPVQAKRLAAMQAIRDQVLNADCFTESGKDEKQK